MRDITIMAPVRRSPHLESLDITNVKNITKHLKKFFNVKLVWLVSVPKNQENISEMEDSRLVYFYNYDNVSDIVDEIKPDLLLVRASLEPINLALLLTGVHKKIFTVTTFFGNLIGLRNTSTVWAGLKAHSRVALSNRVRGEISNQKNSKPLKMLGFFLKKYFFLLRTLQKCSYSVLQILDFNLKYFKIYLSGLEKVNTMFSSDLNVCMFPDNATKLKELGFEESKIIVVGNPAFDELFLRVQKMKKKKVSSEKTKILFCPAPLHEHGIWSKKVEDEIILKIINELLKNQEFDVSLKIHPTSSHLDEYRELISTVHHEIKIFQKEDLFTLMEEFDVMVTYGGTTAILIGVLCKKPVVYMDIVDASEIAMEEDRNVTIKCNSIKELPEIISQSKNHNISKEILDKYLEKRVGKFDGKCAERIVNNIIPLIEKSDFEESSSIKT